jgi:bile acid-coenzyme A ligase
VAIVSFPRRLADLAEAAPDRPALTVGPARVTRAELEERADRVARALRDDGVTAGAMVTIAFPNSVDWFVAFVAALKLGAVPQPVPPHLPERELAAIVELADPPVVLGVPEGAFGARRCRPSLSTSGADPVGGALADVVSPAWKAPTSGGSTGRPKLIVAGQPALLDDEADPLLRVRRDGCLVMPGPLYHNGPIVWSMQGLLQGNHVVVLPRFEAEATLAAIEAHAADLVYLVPTMMRRIWRLPVAVREGYDLSSLRVVWHLAEPCPPWLKDAWIDWLGPDRILELYGGTEAQTATVITGPEWLAHRGSVGRPAEGSVMVTDDDGNEVAPGVEGEVWLRTLGDRPTYRYVGAQARRREGGWESLGDRGWRDGDGYLYLGDRTTDMILTGGANVYPAEVEGALGEHPWVRSCAVIGLPDDDLGQRVHAIVEAETGAGAGADGDTLDVDALVAFVAERLARYKVPRSVEVVTEPLRDDAGKVRRGALRAARLASPP